jgi:hypothetical protein
MRTKPISMDSGRGGAGPTESGPAGDVSGSIESYCTAAEDRDEGDNDRNDVRRKNFGGAEQLSQQQPLCPPETTPLVQRTGDPAQKKKGQKRSHALAHWHSQSHIAHAFLSSRFIVTSFISISRAALYDANLPARAADLELRVHSDHGMMHEALV